MAAKKREITKDAIDKITDGFRLKHIYYDLLCEIASVDLYIRANGKPWWPFILSDEMIKQRQDEKARLQELADHTRARIYALGWTLIETKGGGT